MATQQDNFRVRYGLDVGNKINAATSTTAYASINLPHGNAPTTPTNGDAWTTTAGIFVHINGTTVGPLGSGGGSGVTVSDTAPGSPAVGDLWYESDTGITFIYYDSFWVEIAGAGPVGPTGPAGPAAAWGSITGTLSAQTDLQSVLDAKVALAGTQTITGLKTFANNVLIEHDSVTPVDALTFDTYYASDGPGIVMRRAKGTKATPTTVATGSTLGSIDIYAHDGTSWSYEAYIEAQVNGTVTTGDAPTNLRIAASKAILLRTMGGTPLFSVEATGKVAVGTALPDVYTNKLEVNGSTGGAGITGTVTADISGTTMTVSAVASGVIAVGDLVMSESLTRFVQPGTYVTAFGTGSGGTGTYTLSTSQTVSSGTVYICKAYLTPNIRIRNLDAVQDEGGQSGTLEFWSDDDTASANGVRAYIAMQSTSQDGANDLLFGTSAAAVAGATERMRINSIGQMITGLGSAALPVLSFTGDTNTGIWSPGADTVAISTGGVKRAEFNSLGELTMGNAANTYKSYLWAGNLNVESAVSVIPNIAFYLGGGATLAAPAAVTGGLTMGELEWWGHDGTDYRKSAHISVDTTGTISANVVPSTIWIKNTDTTGALLSRLQIDPDGKTWMMPFGSSASAHAYIEADGTINQKSTAAGNIEVTRYSAAGGPSIRMRRSTSSTVGGAGGVVSGSGLGIIAWFGWDTTLYSTGAQISAFADGTWSATSTPTYIKFETVATATTTLVERMRMEADGTIRITPTGVITSPYSRFDPDGTLQFRTTASGSIGILRYSSTSEPSINLQRSLSDTMGVGATVTSGSGLGSIRFHGWNTATYGVGAYIQGVSEATWTASSYPTRLEFLVAASGGTAVTERMRIASTGLITGSQATGGATAFLGTHFYGLTGARTLSNATGAQSIFGVGLTVAASTTYEIEMEVAISSSGTTTAIKSLSFGGTATLTSIGYQVDYTHSATSVATTGASNNLWVATAAATGMGATSTTNYSRYKVKGLVRVNATGTFIPQIQWSAAPGAAPSVVINSHVKMTPIGSNTVTTIGTWA